MKPSKGRGGEAACFMDYFMITKPIHFLGLRLANVKNKPHVERVKLLLPAGHLGQYILSSLKRESTRNICLNLKNGWIFG